MSALHFQLPAPHLAISRLASSMAYTAVVTGANGYIAAELTKQLLEKGYNVRGTVRDKTDTAKTGHLLALDHALPGKLELWDADLLTDGSFDAVFSGADFVFHTASPFFNDASDPQKELVDPAVNGTRNVMTSVAKNRATVRRVVLTSSVAAARSSGASTPPVNPPLFSEQDWNETSTLEKGAYALSKSLAEKEAWKLAKELDLDLVTILPTYVVGPLISGRASTSVKFFVDMLAATKTLPSPLHYADVRDVGRAHILAAETPGASGRYLVGYGSMTPSKDITDIYQARFPDYDLIPGQPGDTKQVLDTSKAQRELGLHLMPLSTSFVDMAVTLIDLGVVTPKQKWEKWQNGKSKE